MTKKSITKEEINELPMARFAGPIQLITTKEGCLKAVDALAKAPVLGFDTETRPSFKKGEFHHVCLLQLSTNDEAFLFRLNHCGLGPELMDLLADSTIEKAGVAIRDDLKALRKLNEFTPGGFTEIADLAKAMGIKQLGLRSLAAMMLDLRVSKKFKVTNWEQKRLNEDQLRYAATDAWIGYQLFYKFQELLSQEE